MMTSDTSSICFTPTIIFSTQAVTNAILFLIYSYHTILFIFNRHTQIAPRLDRMPATNTTFCRRPFQIEKKTLLVSPLLSRQQLHRRSQLIFVLRNNIIMLFHLRRIYCGHRRSQLIFVLRNNIIMLFHLRRIYCGDIFLPHVIRRVHIFHPPPDELFYW